MISTVNKVLSLLTPRERRHGMIVFALVAFMAIFEAASVVSVAPFLAVLADPDLVETNTFLAWLSEFTELRDTDNFLIFLGVASFVLIILAAIVRTISQYALTHFTQMRRHTIGRRLLSSYLRQPYEFFFLRNSGDLSKSILSEADQLVVGIFQPAATIVAKGLTLFAIVALLIIIDPWVALVSGLTLTTTYFVIFAATRRYLARIGADRVIANRSRFEATNEALGGIKEIKIAGREYAFLERFSKPSRTASRYLSFSQVLGELPKFIVEAITFGAILLLCLYLMVRNGGHDSNALGQVLPLLGLYTFAGYRLLPAVQAIYKASTQFKFGQSALDSVYLDASMARSAAQLLRDGPPQRLPFLRTLRLESVSYSYPGTASASVSDVSFEIVRGSTVGVVGTTGSGKTTLIDLLLGLLSPQSGHLFVDNKKVGPENFRSWQANIGYVAQDIFLTDATIASNIALGVPPDQVNHSRVAECAKLADIDEFVTETLPDAYETRVGERGVRLSGGQKQRIGIARALYHDPEVIVLDEATSALDVQTEQRVMRAVNALHGTKTIVVIAHRLATIRSCDNILVLDQGRLVDQGSYRDLAARSAPFQKMIAADQI